MIRMSYVRNWFIFFTNQRCLVVIRFCCCLVDMGFVVKGYNVVWSKQGSGSDQRGVLWAPQPPSLHFLFLGKVIVVD